MTNDSSTKGFLRPNTSPAPLEDDALANFMQAMIVGLTGLSGTLVRPRWQPKPPNLPENTVNWASVGVKAVPAQEYAYEGHDPTGDGQDFVQRHEELDILCSFYGPNALGYAAMVRDGLSVEQNRAYLTAAGMGLMHCGDAIPAPELVNNIWYYRVDISIFIRRDVTRTYKILNLLSANGDIVTDVSPLVIPFSVTNI